MELQATSDTGVSIKLSKTSLVMNPHKKQGKDITLTTYPVPFSGWGEVLSGGDDDHCQFSGPGEYEKGGVLVHGYGSETVLQGKPVQTTSWLVTDDEIRIAILGDLSRKEDAQRFATDVGSAHVLILFSPKASGEERLGVPALANVVVSLACSFVVLVGSDTVLQKQLGKEVGSLEEITGKYVMKKKDILGATSGVQAILLS